MGAFMKDYRHPGVVPAILALHSGSSSTYRVMTTSPFCVPGGSSQSLPASDIKGATPHKDRASEESANEPSPKLIPVL
jgi:hypothetical protein